MSATSTKGCVGDAVGSDADRSTKAKCAPSSTNAARWQASAEKLHRAAASRPRASAPRTIFDRRTSAGMAPWSTAVLDKPCKSPPVMFDSASAKTSFVTARLHFCSSFTMTRTPPSLTMRSRASTVQDRFNKHSETAWSTASTSAPKTVPGIGTALFSVSAATADAARTSPSFGAGSSTAARILSTHVARTPTMPPSVSAILGTSKNDKFVVAKMTNSGASAWSSSKSAKALMAGTRCSTSWLRSEESARLAKAATATFLQWGASTEAAPAANVFRHMFTMASSLPNPLLK
mmetsp:Transcript_20269/g.68671  ORF Transcript_20269/g.68671 Transcript_20269/m.68671 type:complete len:291 (-) Transcript_20269:1045-1917(-)